MSGIQEPTERSGHELQLEEQLSYSLRRQLVHEYQAREFALFPKGAQLLDIGGVKANTRGHFFAEEFPLRRITVNLLRSHRVISENSQMVNYTTRFGIRAVKK